jgi:CspA family cold shock protein
VSRIHSREAPPIQKEHHVAEGTIKKVTDKGFGFIAMASGGDIFFHQSGLVDVNFEQLQVGQRVTFTEGQGPKGPRAESIRLV